jgi:hypothetical protein
LDHLGKTISRQPKYKQISVLWQPANKDSFIVYRKSQCLTRIHDAQVGSQLITGSEDADQNTSFNRLET